MVEPAYKSKLDERSWCELFGRVENDPDKVN